MLVVYKLLKDLPIANATNFKLLYMPAITKDDLKTHIYPEIVTLISRSDDAIVNECINNAEGEMKSYLNRFDKTAMFNGNFNNAFFKGLLKDLACWHLIKLSNPNINLELFRTAYEDAIKKLEQIAMGKIQPEFPLAPDNPATGITESGHIEWGSNPKRNNHY